jgi:hypothetical protein
MNKLYIISILLFLFTFLANLSFSQQDDSLLLQKISSIDVSFDSFDDSDEDLYDNPVSFQTFYDDLAPDGDWIMITKEEIEKELNDGEGQGYASYYLQEDELVYVWKPNEAGDEWRPYMNGKWVYTTSGWMWVSNYRWGWACFHYGRWMKSRTYGWVWLPGYVWAPAWVKWRIAENHVGWCPLTPRAKWKGEEGITSSTYSYNNPGNQWVFVEKSKFVDDIDKSNIVSANENSNFIKNSESVLEIKKENGRIFGKGPGVDDIQKRTGRLIHAKEIKYRKEKALNVVGQNDVSIFRESFKRHEKMSETGKYVKSDKPKKFKKSAKAWKLYRKIKILKRRPLHRIQ